MCTYCRYSSSLIHHYHEPSLLGKPTVEFLIYKVHYSHRVPVLSVGFFILTPLLYRLVLSFVSFSFATRVWFSLIEISEIVYLFHSWINFHAMSVYSGYIYTGMDTLTHTRTHILTHIIYKNTKLTYTIHCMKTSNSCEYKSQVMFRNACRTLEKGMPRVKTELHRFVTHRWGAS